LVSLPPCYCFPNLEVHAEQSHEQTDPSNITIVWYMRDETASTMMQLQQLKQRHQEEKSTSSAQEYQNLSHIPTVKKFKNLDH
jgi:hypothetical protein